jgi:hypothetical protein
VYRPAELLAKDEPQAGQGGVDGADFDVDPLAASQTMLQADAVGQRAERHLDPVGSVQ